MLPPIQRTPTEAVSLKLLGTVRRHQARMSALRFAPRIVLPTTEPLHRRRKVGFQSSGRAELRQKLGVGTNVMFVATKYLLPPKTNPRDRDCAEQNVRDSSDAPRVGDPLTRAEPTVARLGSLKVTSCESVSTETTGAG